MNLLLIKSSLFGNDGVSSRLADELVAARMARHPDLQVTVRDLAADPVPHLDADRFHAFLAKPQERTPAQQAAVDYSDALIAELKRADVIVLGLPMYNFALPSTLKAYFDHIARAGATFKYTDAGSVGLLGGKKVYVVAARGGRYAGTANDSESAYVRYFLAFLGLTDVEFVFAEGLTISEESRKQGLERAHEHIARLGEPERLAA